MLNNYKISSKLLLISLAYMVPVLFLTYSVIVRISANIDFATYEQYGNQYQRPLENILKPLGEHRVAAARAAGSTTGSDSSLKALQGQIEQGFAELSKVHEEVGEALQFTDEGLGKRSRSHLKFETVYQKWQSLVPALAGKSAEEVSKLHVGLIADIRGLIAHAGDTSNLILDPDLDSYYLMDVTLLALHKPRTA
jgi:methyl-accepting chemotaxis protein